MMIIWLGHVMRMEDDRIPKEILKGTTHGERRKERLKRWLEDVENCPRKIGIGDCRRRLVERGVWRRLVGKAKAHRGVLRQGSG